MPNITRDQAKQYLRTGLYPTQAQFWAILDALLFSGEVQIDDIENLTTTLQGKAADADLQALKLRLLPEVQAGGVDTKSYTMPAGFMLELVAMYATDDTVVTVGLSPSSDDLVPAIDIKGNQWNILQLNFFAEVDTDIYFINAAEIHEFKFYKR